MKASELMVMFRNSNPDFLKRHNIINVQMQNNKLYIYTSEDFDYIYDGLTDSVRRKAKRNNSQSLRIGEADWLKLFSKRLRSLMDKRDINSHQLAQMSGVGYSTVRMYVKGEVMPTAYKLVRIARALCVPPSKLIDL